MTASENFQTPHVPSAGHPLHGGPGHGGHNLANGPLRQTEDKLEGIIKSDPQHQRMSEVYRELEDLRQKDQTHFGKNLQAINRHLHKDGLLPNLTIVQDHYTGDDKKDHVGYSLVATDRNNPGRRVGTEVGTNHPRVPDTPASKGIYQGLSRPGRRNYKPSRDSAEGGPAADGGYDPNLAGEQVPEGERKDLIDQALKVAGVPVNEANEKAMNKIITRESHWNSNIVNTWDSNARKGDPSKGLMQVIHSTFEANRNKSLPDNQLDPIANMVAALNYMGVRYGHGNKEAGLHRVAARNSGY